MRNVNVNNKEVVKRIEAAGRKIGNPHGTHVTDLAELANTIILCDFCVPKFDWKKYRYYKQREFPYVLGKCDACKTFGRAQLFIHWSEVKKCWATREKQRWF